MKCQDFFVTLHKQYKKEQPFKTVGHRDKRPQPTMTREELIDELIENDESQDRQELVTAQCHDLVNMWLNWNCIYGYTDEVIDVVFAAYEPISLQMSFDELDYEEQVRSLAQLYDCLSPNQKKLFKQKTENV